MIFGYDYSFPSFTRVSTYNMELDSGEIIFTKKDMSDNIIEQYDDIDTQDNPFTQNITTVDSGLIQIFNGSMFPIGFLYTIEDQDRYSILNSSIKTWAQNNVIQTLYDISYSAAIRFDSGGNPSGIIYTISYVPGNQGTAESASLSDLNEFFQRLENISGREITDYIINHYDPDKQYQFIVNVTDRLLGVVFFDYELS